MLDLGYVLPGSTINVPFATYDSNDPSASVTTTGLAAGDVEIYRDGSLTQRAGGDAGITVDTDYDTITGLHTVQIDLSDNSDAGYYRAGSEYIVGVSSITVDAATINLWLCRFFIGIPGMLHGSTIAVYTSTDNFTLNTGSTDNDAYNGCILIAYDVATQYQTQIGVIEDYTGATRTVNLLSDPGIFTMTANDNIIIMPPSYPAGAVVSDIAAIESELIVVHSETTVVQSQTTVIESDSIIVESSVQAIEAWGDPGSDLAAIESELILVHSETTVIQSQTTVIESDSIIVESSVQAIEGWGLTSVASDAAAIESELIVTHSETTVIQGWGDPSSDLAAIESELIVVHSETTVIQSDTTGIESSVGPIVTGTADSGSTTTMVDAARTEADTDYWTGKLIKFTSGTIDGQCRLITGFNPTTDTITFYPATTQAVATNTYDILPLAGIEPIYSDTTLVESNSVVLDSSVAVIEGWGLTSVASDAAAIESELIVVHSETTVIASDSVVVESSVQVVESQTTRIESDLDVLNPTEAITTAATLVDNIWDEALTAGSHDVADSAGQRLREVQSDTTVLESDSIIIESSVQVVESQTTVIESDVTLMSIGIITGVAQTGTLSTTQATTDLSGYADDQLIGRVLVVTSGAADGEATDITDYASASGLLTFTALTTAMANNDTFKIV